MAVDYNRKLVPVEKEGAHLYNTTLPQVLAKIEKWIEEYGKTAYFEMETDPYSNSNQSHMHVYRDEPETDEQYNARIAQEENWETQANARDRLEYDRLQKKFAS